MKREKSHKESSPNCFLAPFVLSVRAKKMQQKHFKDNIVKEILQNGKRKKERKKTSSPYKIYEHLFLRLIKMSFIIDQQYTAWGNPETSRKEIFPKACAHSRINRTLKGINR